MAIGSFNGFRNYGDDLTFERETRKIFTCFRRSSLCGSAVFISSFRLLYFALIKDKYIDATHDLRQAQAEVSECRSFNIKYSILESAGSGFICT
ncbi:hypothetical protein AVEN_208993-1 [Araneus ventricosus]|uniref:Uncharacterized protein n=1 Tax=Araneus ventricosus TaxID=182803 RepID=A0A4Y2CPE6_ARAVE|nr:hypothetical protein AVEN_208993-1 [Araneus ventricosus]